MKYSALLNYTAWMSVFAILLIAIGCDSSTDPPPPAGCTGLPYDFDKYPGGYYQPQFRYRQGELSPDGKTLAYIRTDGLVSRDPRTPFTTLFFYDIATGKQSFLEKISLPENVRLAGITGFRWCPYDPDILIIDARTLTHPDSNYSYILGSNTYIIRRDGTFIRRATPSSMPWYGNDTEITTVAWLRGSTPDADSLVMWDMYTGTSIFIPQEARTVEPYYFPFAQSRDGSLWYGTDLKNGYALPYTVNGYPVNFDNLDDTFHSASFSPSGKLLAISGLSWNSCNECPNTVILDIEAWMLNTSRDVPVVASIKFQEQFCMYNQSRADPVFLTDSTLAVSMFAAYAPYAHYYEISISGRLIRQLSQPL